MNAKKLEMDSLSQTRSRILIVLYVFMIALAVVIFFIYARSTGILPQELLMSIPLAGILGVFAAMLIRYLQVDRQEYNLDVSKKIIKSNYHSVLNNSNKNNHMKEEEVLWRSTLQNFLTSNIDAIKDDKALRVNQSRQKISVDTAELDIINIMYANTKARLSDEIFALRRRGNLNLVLGVIVSGLGFCILAYYLTSFTYQKYTTEQFVWFFLSRLSLVILIEVFAYFFLALYRSSLADIKEFQNELTLIENRMLAAYLSIKNNDQAGHGCVIAGLMQERANVCTANGNLGIDQLTLRNLSKALLLASRNDEDKA